jgi:hypothetical protein
MSPDKAPRQPDFKYDALDDPSVVIPADEPTPTGDEAIQTVIDRKKDPIEQQIAALEAQRETLGESDGLSYTKEDVEKFRDTSEKITTAERAARQEAASIFIGGFALGDQIALSEDQKRNTVLIVDDTLVEAVAAQRKKILEESQQ